jgi:hypothetical protein
MARELIKMGGIRNLILLLLLGLVLSYLFSHDKCFDVVMAFLTTIPVDANLNMQPTRAEDESDFGEWEDRLKKLALCRVEKKVIRVPSVNCHWRAGDISWYAENYLYMHVKYVLYYDKYCFIRDSGTKYAMRLTNIMAGVHRKFDLFFSYIPGNVITTYFHHAYFDLFVRSSKLQVALYTEVHNEICSCETSMRRIANYSGVLVSPSLICRLRKDTLKVA